MSVYYLKTWATLDPPLLLLTGFSVLVKTKYNLNIEWAILLPASRVAVIPDKATTRAMQECILILASIELITMFFLFHQVHAKRNPSCLCSACFSDGLVSYLLILHQLVSFAANFFWSCSTLYLISLSKFLFMLTAATCLSDKGKQKWVCGKLWQREKPVFN